MKSKIFLSLGVILLFAIVACGLVVQPLFHSIVYGQEYNTTDTNIMVVFYQLADEQYLWWADLSVDIIDNGDGTWDIYSPQFTATGVSQALIGYGYWRYQEIEFEYDENNDPLPLYLDDLNLQPVQAEDLPHSQHIGKLVEINPGNGKPAVITRWWHGYSFNIS